MRMESLRFDERTCVVDALSGAHLLTLRLVSTEWRDTVDAHVRQTYDAPLEHMLSHLRIRGKRPTWLLRYATRGDHEQKWRARYVCAKCGAGVYALGECVLCRQPSITVLDWTPLFRRLFVTACVSLCLVCATLTLTILHVARRASNSRG